MQITLSRSTAIIITSKCNQKYKLQRKRKVEIQCPPLILAPLVNMTKGGCENKSALFILFIFHSKKFTKFQPIIEVKQLKVEGKSHCEINAFTILCWPQLLAPNYCNVLFPAQQLWVFSYNAWRVWRTPDKRSETIFFIQNLSRSFRFTAPWRCFFSSVHLTHFL